MPEILPNPFTDPKKLPKRSLFDRGEKDEKQAFIDQAMAKGLQAAQESTKKKFSDPELQKIWDEIEEKIENGEIKLHEITIGGKTKEQMIQEIEAAGMKIEWTAKQMMDYPVFKTSTDESEIELIEFKGDELGLPNFATLSQIYDRAKELGYMLCPAEVGPQLRLQYPDQPLEENLIIAMESLSPGYGPSMVFYVDHNDDGRNLRGSSNHLGLPWTSSNYHVVFRRK